MLELMLVLMLAHEMCSWLWGKMLVLYTMAAVVALVEHDSSRAFLLLPMLELQNRGKVAVASC